MIAKLQNIINNIRINKGLDPLIKLDPVMQLRNDLGFDSLDLAEFTVHVDHEFGVDVFEDGLVNSIEEVIKKIKLN